MHLNCACVYQSECQSWQHPTANSLSIPCFIGCVNRNTSPCSEIIKLQLRWQRAVFFIFFFNLPKFAGIFATWISKGQLRGFLIQPNCVARTKAIPFTTFEPKVLFLVERLLAKCFLTSAQMPLAMYVWFALRHSLSISPFFSVNEFRSHRWEKGDGYWRWSECRIGGNPAFNNFSGEQTKSSKGT